MAPSKARIGPDFVPRKAKHIRHAFGLRFSGELNSVQVVLRAQKGDRVGNLIYGNVDAAIFFELR